MTPAPTVSVLMSVHNGARYLALAMDSILAQTLADLELVVIDDGSTDASPSILRDYARRDPRVRLTVRENRGLTPTLNEAFAASRGSFVARMDCDDIAMPDRLAVQVAFLRARPDIVCVGGYTQLIDTRGRLLTTLRPPLDDAAIQRLTMAGHGAITHPAATMPRDALARVGGYDESFRTAQDLDLWLRLGEIGRLANLPRVVLKFRLHPGSVSGRFASDQRASARRACELACARRGVTVPFEAADPWRPGADHDSNHRYTLRYGWWAWKSGERRTATLYGTRAVLAKPWEPAGYKLVLCALARPNRRPDTDAPLADDDVRHVSPEAHPTAPANTSTTMNRPTVSTLLPVYNSERYLQAAVRSVLAQTMSDLELIAVDDGSTDGSLAILRSIAATDPRVVIVSRPNTGISRALNDGLAVARGEFVARMDADDVSLPERFEKQVAFLRANPDVVCVGGAWQVIDDADRLITVLNGPLDDAAIQHAALQGHAAITHPCAMIRRSSYEQVGGYNEFFRHGEDLDLWLRLGEIGQLANLPDVILRYRVHAGSISENHRYEQRRYARLACEQAWARRGTPGTFAAGEPWRPGRDRASRNQFALQYGWWAWKAGQRRTAALYGTRAVLAKPWEPAGYKLLLCAMIKPRPTVHP